MSDLTFTIHGNVVSNNRVARFGSGDRPHKSKEAREDTKRIREIATVAATAAGWVNPDACCLEILAFNCRKDAGNVEKCIADALNGVVYRDDSDIMELTVSKHWDRGGERYEVSVMPCFDRRPGATLKKAKGGNGARPLSKIRSGEVITSFEERDAILAKALR